MFGLFFLAKVENIFLKLHNFLEGILMSKEFIYLIFLLIILLIINFIGGIKPMYNFLLLILIGVVIFRIDDIKELTR